jgi:hypothetical protein
MRNAFHLSPWFYLVSQHAGMHTFTLNRMKEERGKKAIREVNILIFPAVGPNASYLVSLSLQSYKPQRFISHNSERWQVQDEGACRFSVC